MPVLLWDRSVEYQHTSLGSICDGNHTHRTARTTSPVVMDRSLLSGRNERETAITQAALTKS